MAAEKEQESKKEGKQEGKQEEKQEGKQQEKQEQEQEQEQKPDNRPPSIVWGPSAPKPLTLTFGALLDYHAEVRGNKPAVISHVQGTTTTFKQLRDRSLSLARAFSQDGIKKGDLVAISMGSRVEYFEVGYSNGGQSSVLTWPF